MQKITKAEYIRSFDGKTCWHLGYASGHPITEIPGMTEELFAKNQCGTFKTLAAKARSKDMVFTDTLDGENLYEGFYPGDEYYAAEILNGKLLVHRYAQGGATPVKFVKGEMQ